MSVELRLRVCRLMRLRRTAEKITVFFENAKTKLCGHFSGEDVFMYVERLEAAVELSAKALKGDPGCYCERPYRLSPCQPCGELKSRALEAIEFAGWGERV